MSQFANIPTEQLVEALWERNRDLLAAQKDIAEISAELIARGPGKRTGHDPEHAVTIVAAGEAGVKYIHLDEAVAKKVREICGESFADLYEREVSFKPRTGFTDRVDAVLTAGQKKSLFALVEQPTKARAAYLLGLPRLA